jgi:peptide/nickel transport system permease protein
MDRLAAPTLAPEPERPDLPPAPPVVRDGHRMRRLIWRRFVAGFVLLFLASVLVFTATQALPGDTARAVLGKDATPERVEALREEFGLDRPLLQQYTSWAAGLATGDLGESLVSQRPVADVLATRVRNTATLLVAAVVISLPLSLASGIWLARRRGRRSEQVSSAVLLGAASLPEFVVGIGLIVLFATGVFTILPAVSLLPADATPWTEPKVLVLPVLALALLVVPYLSRMVRAAMSEALESDYVEMARLKGLPDRQVVFRHALPNALPPIAQVAAIVCAYLAGGSVVIETLFAYPGLGSALVEAVRVRDLPVLQACVLAIGAFYIAVSIVADVVTIAVTPKERVG